MGVGDLTVTIVGSYATLVAAVSAMDSGNDALVTDQHYLIIEPAVGVDRFHVIKYARTSA